MEFHSSESTNKSSEIFTKLHLMKKVTTSLFLLSVEEEEQVKLEQYMNALNVKINKKISE